MLRRTPTVRSTLRYEDLWVNKDESLQIPDLAAIDLEFDESEE